MSRCLFVVLLVGVACGPSKPAVTVPAPVAMEAPPPSKIEPKPAALAPPQPTLRLPRNFAPTSYAARLAIDPAKSGFTGAIAIAGTVTEPSLALWLHARKLTIAHASAERPGSAPIALVATPRGEDLLELRAPTPLAAGAWTIAIEYAGELDLLNTTGAFKQIVDGAPYVFSQFEAVYARRVFPCLDEPDSKVPWTLTLDVPKSLVAVSNAPVATEAPLAADTKRIEFRPTKPLPAYLIAFAVGPFEVIDAGKTKSGVPVRIVTLAKRGADGAYAAKTTPKLVDYLEDWFGIPYPYEKLDMLSIPITVGFGAMENAGLVTFTETLMLLDKNSSVQRQNEWVTVAAHELAHQWFGDLVTTAWWDDIWLNEGFANWMERKIAGRYDPSWHLDQSELEMRDVALNDDALVTARKIRQPIATPDDILNAFDGITYDKGASILNMFESYLGAETFQKGVRAYLKERAFGNATSTDFAAAISKAAGRDVGPAFASFLEQTGAPEIAATIDCTGGAPSVNLSQHRFTPPGANTPTAGQSWLVPMCIAYDSGGKRAEQCTLLDQPAAKLALQTKTCPRWVMPNVNGRGYYRNAYTAAEIATLRDEAWPKLSWTERRAVFFDLRGGVITGKLPLALAISFAPKLLSGGDRFPVDAVVVLARDLANFVPDDLQGKYEAWLRLTFGAAAAKAGLAPKPTDSLDVETSRHGLVAMVGWRAHDPALVADAVRLAASWRDLPQSSRDQVLDIAVDADAALFDKILRDVHTETDRQRRSEMLNALAGVRDPGREQQALALLIDPTLDMRESLWMVFAPSTEANRVVAQQFFKAHAAQILARLPQDETAGPDALLAGLFTQSCRASDRDAVVAYITEMFAKRPGGARVIAQRVEELDQCIAIRKLVEPQLRAWLGGMKVPAVKKKRV